MVKNLILNQIELSTAEDLYKKSKTQYIQKKT